MPEGIGPWASGMRQHAGCPSNFESRALFCGEDSLERGLTPRSDVLMHSIVIHHRCIARMRETYTREKPATAGRFR